MKETTIDLILVAGLLLAGILIYEKSKGPLAAAATAVGNTAVNAATGSLSDSQNQALINSEAQQLIAASGGTMPEADAIAQATADVNASNNSQPGFWASVWNML